ncbi:I/LWEQ domain-containing protein [Cavenderia fasciculata]|uniref:I/LWEQ domain-containing protein n=1 Tax=Cavenderia fasciculata TaxID=261658 RepID=F4QBP4_CACFS|nr:I/LWEQ domain-containing protein [Cavenderia fasciculata]EGG14632.1 I/LWEQ domain-containing protein [Cavenderia fasciculata]|eukprot:XP_004351140.1 I/LWEQ domain-containing protein [Cavenderia fasciculata]
MSEFEQTVHKATNSKITAPKRKHVRAIVLTCYADNSARPFFNEIYKRPLDTNDVVCYKALTTIHKVVQEGPKNVLADTSKKINWFESLRAHWSRYPDTKGFGHLIAEYCTFFVDKIRFHIAHPEFDGGLSIENFQKNNKFEDVEIDRSIQTVSHLMDLLDAVFRMQNAVVDAAPYNDCKTSSFIPLVLESYAIYLLVVQFLTALVDKVDTMEVIEFAIQRFYTQYQTLRNFYLNANAINSVSSVIAVPNLPPDPPKFIRKRREAPKQRPPPKELSPPPVRQELPPPVPEVTQIPVPVPTPVFIRQTVPVYANPFMQQQQDNSMWGGQFGGGGPQMQYQQQPQQQMIHTPPQPMQMPQQPPPQQQFDHNKQSQWVTFNNEEETNNRSRSQSQQAPLEKKEAQLVQSSGSPTSSLPSTALSGGSSSAEKTRVITKVITKTVSNTAELNALRARVEELEKLLAEEQDKNKALQLRLSEREAMIQEVTVARKRLAEMTDSNNTYTSEVVKQNEQLREQYMALRDYYEKQRLTRLEADFTNVQKSLNAYISSLDNPNNLGNPDATHQLVIEDLAHHMSQAQSLLNLCSKEGDIPEMDIFGAVNLVSDSLKNLFSDAKGASRLILDQGLQSRFLDAARRIGGLTQNLFESVRLQGGQCQDEEDRKRMAAGVSSLQKGVGELENLARTAENAQAADEKKLEDQGFDLDDLAERELMAAAKAIEDAANSLLAAKAKRPPKKEGEMPDVQEAILEAAMAITSATSTLVGAATLAQRERVEKGRAGGPNGPLYRRDPTWAEGLISAAKAVAATTRALVDTANKAASGQEIPGGTEEALIATSKAVTAATSQLVAACKSKSDINSPSQHKLSNAAKSVQHATNLLVAAAKAVAANVAAEEEIDFSGLTITGFKVKEMEQQMAILRLEKELEYARKGLSGMRKQQYQDSAPSI